MVLSFGIISIPLRRDVYCHALGLIGKIAKNFSGRIKRVPSELHNILSRLLQPFLKKKGQRKSEKEELDAKALTVKETWEFPTGHCIWPSILFALNLAVNHHQLESLKLKHLNWSMMARSIVRL